MRIVWGVGVGVFLAVSLSSLIYCCRPLRRVVCQVEDDNHIVRVISCSERWGEFPYRFVEIENKADRKLVSKYIEHDAPLIWWAVVRRKGTRVDLYDRNLFMSLRYVASIDLGLSEVTVFRARLGTPGTPEGREGLGISNL